MEVKWTDLAVQSLSDILDYVEGNFYASLAESVGRDIVAYVDTLADNPKAGRPVSEWSLYGDIRRLVYRQNVIYYQVHNDSIEVILVWDGRRSPWDMQNLLLEYFSKF